MSSPLPGRVARRLGVVLSCCFLASLASPAWSAPSLEELAARLERLEAENRALEEKVARLEAAQADEAAPTAAVQGPPSTAAELDARPPSSAAAAAAAAEAQAEAGAAPRGFLRFDSAHSYAMLDPTTRVNRKQRFLLDQRRKGVLEANSLTLGGAVTAIADYQSSNRAGKFGYLMRHPTSNNQSGQDVSEAVLHSAQLNLTATYGSWVTGYVEALYDPEQSFGAGSITALGRNQVQVRRGFVLLGNLDRSPLYLSLGKMATPFGLTDTVNPFTASTVWHAFGGLAYGMKLGYRGEGLDLALMAVQGGSQFRSANTPVNGTNIPSKLNNWVLDGSYTWKLGRGDGELLVGASYQRGCAYCQDFPVTHFSECDLPNAAFDLHARLELGKVTILAEFAETEDDWPGTFNADIPQFAASKVTSFDLGGRYRARFRNRPLDISLDFSRFVAGPGGAPWEKQDQLVVGVAGYYRPNVKFFGEYVKVDGYAPLNFISGGNLGVGESHSDATASSDVLVVGVNLGF